ncbi:transglutaminase family protein [Thioclava sp. FR2]|uniref:transglutaminase family protein n=1 Tax=Thioclava sp. FR2 TaxID=3445780 RepID=UPI003EB984EA
MLLTVDHVTRYIYDQPVRAVVQSHRLTPSVFEGQRTLRWEVTVSDGMRGGTFKDGAGDWIEGWSVQGPVSEITVRVQGEVETRDLAGVLKGHREVISPEAYLRKTIATEVDTELAKLAVGLATDENPLSAAHELSSRIAEAIEYTAGSTTSSTTAAEAMALGRGVCQDHAHALIAVARHIGMPARYVSGYLLADNEGKKHEAAHAWAEIYISSLGWVGFDPSNSCCPDDRYIRLGSGFDAQDAAPIRGTTRGPGEESLAVIVSVQTQQ